MSDLLFRERKYTLAWAVLLIATFLCVLDKVSGEAWCWVAFGIISMYGAQNVMAKKFMGGPESGSEAQGSGD
jgi:hypothetical protein